MLPIMTNKTNPDINLVIAVNILLFIINNFRKMDTPSKLKAGTPFSNANASENIAM
jgi:hypothetical protein